MLKNCSNQKTKALLRIRHYLNIQKAKYLFNAFVMSPFNYFRLVWMFCGKQSHTLVNSTHRRALSAMLKNHSPFDELLKIPNSKFQVTIHTKNLRLLMVEVYKSL